MDRVLDRLRVGRARGSRARRRRAASRARPASRCGPARWVATTRLPTTSPRSRTGAASAARIPSAANAASAVRGRRVVLDHDQLALGGRPPAGALRRPGCGASRSTQLGLDARARRPSPAGSGSSGSSSRRPTVSSPSRSSAPVDDRVEDLLEVAPADDRALDPREALEQPLALAQRLEQARVLGALAVAERAQAALGLDDAQQPHGQRQHPRHARGRGCAPRREGGPRGGRARAPAGARRRSGSTSACTRRSRAPRAARCAAAHAARSPRRHVARGRSRSPRATSPSAERIAPDLGLEGLGARSTASRIAAGSSSAAETAARNSVSCWAAQLSARPSAERSRAARVSLSRTRGRPRSGCGAR